MNTNSIALFAAMLLIAVLLHWLPLWRRSYLWFGVTVAPDFRTTAEARQVLKQYRTATWLATLAGCILMVAGIRLHVDWMAAAGPVLPTITAAVAFARGHSRMRPFSQHGETNRAAPLSGTTEGLPGGIAGIAVPFGILTATAIFLHRNWALLPARLPVHWGMSGIPDRWAERSWRSVDGLLLAGALTIAVMYLLGYMVLRGSPRARISKTAEWTARFRRANLRLLVAMGWTISLLLSALALNPYLASGEQLAIPVWVILGAVLAVAAGFLWPIIRLSQEPGSGSDGTPDECWKLGQIYYNPDDPALMVEKRFGLGYTINFGNPASWLIIALLLVVVFVPLLL